MGKEAVSRPIREASATAFASVEDGDLRGSELLRIIGKLRWNRAS